MKKLSLSLAGANPVITQIAIGVWKIVNSGATVTRLCVLNQTANQNVEDWGGYNLINTAADTGDFPSGISISVKQYLNYAAEFQLTPPQGILKNYRTLQEAALAVENGTDTQGVIIAASV